MQLTKAASEELQQLLRDNLAGPRQGVRLQLDTAGHLAMTIDMPHLGDVVVRHGPAPLLIIEARLVDRLAGRVLDYPGSINRRAAGGFVLLWRTPEATAPVRAGPV